MRSSNQSKKLARLERSFALTGSISSPYSTISPPVHNSQNSEHTTQHDKSMRFSRITKDKGFGARHRDILACAIGVAFACNSALGELGFDVDDLFHDWTYEPPNLDDIWRQPNSPAPEVQLTSPWNAQHTPTWTPQHIDSEPPRAAGSEARKRDFELGPSTFNPSAASLPLMPHNENRVGLGANQSDQRPAGSLLNFPDILQNFHFSRLDGPFTDSVSVNPTWNPSTHGTLSQVHINQEPTIPTCQYSQAAAADAQNHELDLWHLPWSPAPEISPQLPASKRPKTQRNPSPINIATENSLEKKHREEHHNLEAPTDQNANQLPATLNGADAVIKKPVRTKSRRTRINALPETPQINLDPTFPASTATALWSSSTNTSQEKMSQLTGPDALKFERLVFKEETFKYTGLWPDHYMHRDKIKRLNRAVRYFPEYDGLFMDKDRPKENASLIEQFTHHVSTPATEPQDYVPLSQAKRETARQNFWSNSSRTMLPLNNLWLRFWENRSGMNLHMDFRTLERDLHANPNDFLILFLFYVDMIHTITERDRDPATETEFFQHAVNAFQGYRQSDQFKEKIKQHLYIFKDVNEGGQTEQFVRPSPRVALWYYLQYWMDLPHNNLWNHLGRAQMNLVKGFFNDIFAYSIRHFNLKLLAASSNFQP
ncbi:hypothetical protein PGTUg99_020484 [Puccinia graminis f. sp. tritici]|uniref:Uncharacterized protein n=1 Tax=Puccinia graminis f. sp. tritici TaxID=56615 RepID=A0A5B0MWK1_PUCGR|nr:hypothetical protein PGTUg99_020484 [Puccinia graminis f. sp. tritici]